MHTAVLKHDNNHQHDTSNAAMQAARTDRLSQQLDTFFRGQQQQAYAIALLKLNNEADALDVIQETMLAFLNNYVNKPQADWRPLFYRVLQNKINDFYRKQKSWLRMFFNHANKDEMAAAQASEAPVPDQLMETFEMGDNALSVIKSLPAKQQQVVIYRLWQEMSVQETATIMQISAGSVKTHLFRATQKLKTQLGDHHGK